MSTKSIAYLFLGLSILNIPVMAFFYSGAGTQTDDPFARLSLGNVGSPALVCDDGPNLQLLYNTQHMENGQASFSWSEYNDASEMSLNCGTGSTLVDLVGVGIPST